MVDTIGKACNLVKLTIKNKLEWKFEAHITVKGIVILIYYKYTETYLLRNSRKRSGANKLWYLPPSRHLMALA